MQGEGEQRAEKENTQGEDENDEDKVDVKVSKIYHPQSTETPI